VVDLTATSEFTFTLLGDTWAWRQRLVEEFAIGSTWHAQVSSAYQVEFPDDMLPSSCDGADAVRVLLPMATRPKRPLLGLDIRNSAGWGCHLLLRVSIAAIQAEYLARLRDGLELSDRFSAGVPDALLEAISVFTPDVYKEFDPDGKWSPDRAANYLSAGLGFQVTAEETVPLCAMQAQAAVKLCTALQEPEDPLSSSEQILLAIPRVEPRPTSVGEVTRVVQEYVASVAEATKASDRGFLVALAEYGRRWEVIVETVVPLREPTRITIVEDRPLGLQKSVTRQLVSLGDARSAHAQFRLTDPAVEFSPIGKGSSIVDIFGNPVGVPYLEGVRDTPEALALYTADPDRPYYLDVRLTLRPTLEVRLVLWALLTLVVLAVAVAARARGPELNTLLGLVTVPTTFAVALLLVREETSLAARLQRGPRLLLLGAVAVLWAVVFARVI